MSEAVSTRVSLCHCINWKGLFASILFFLTLGVFSSVSIAQENTYPELTTANIGGIGSGPMRAFVDVVKTSNRWAQPNGDPLDWDTMRDEQGWPTADFRMILFDWRLFGGWLNPPYDDPERKQIDVSGTYKVSFKGEATVSSWAGDSYVNFSNQVYDAASNTTTLDMYVLNQDEVLAIDSNDNSGLVALQFANSVNPDSATGAGITDLKVIRPGYHDRPEQVFTDEFLNALKPFAALRFMDVQNTNGSNPFQGDPYPRNVTLWQDRITKESPSQILENRGLKQPVVAWEYDIEIANAAGADLWLNIPVHAELDYVKKLAILVAYGVDVGDADVSGPFDEAILAQGVQTTDPLDPSLNVYLEHSNEVWNFGFSQYVYNKLAAVEAADNGFDWGTTDEEHMARRRHIKRAYEFGQIFSEVMSEKYGTDVLLDRVRPVHAHWAAAIGFDLQNQWQSAVDWMETTYGPVSEYFYGFAIAPYMNDNAASDTATPEELLAALVASSDGQAAGGRSTFIDKSVNDWGVAPMVYEGGPDTGGGSTTNVQNRILMNRLPGMKDAVKRDMIDNWFELGGKEFAYFVIAGGASRHGSWGATEDVADLTAPKYQALLEIAGDVSVQLISASVPDGSVNTEYATQLQTFGGVPPIAWTIESGGLPAGLSLNATTGLLSGTPAPGSEGVYSPTIRATDDGGEFDEGEFPFEIIAYSDSAPVFQTSTTLASGQEGSPYQANFIVTGGNGQLNWSVTNSEDLPPGLSFNNGLFSGTPQAAGSYSFEVAVTDSDTNSGAGDEARATFSVVIDENPDIPASPAGLAVNAISATAIDLTWTDNADNETGYEIQISGDGGQNYLQTIDVGPNVTSYSHTELTPETIYYYRVRAVNGSFVSGFSGAAGTTTLPPLPDLDVIAGFDFATYAGNESTATATTVDAGVTVSELTRGAGAVGSGTTHGGELGGFNTSGTRFTKTTLAAAISGEDYFEFSVSPVDGYALDIEEVFFSAYAQRNGTAPGDFSIEVMYSLDGFATDGVSLGGNSGVEARTIGGMLGNPVSLQTDGEAALQGVSSPVTFRIYGYKGAAWTSKGIGFDAGDDLAIRGKVNEQNSNQAKAYNYLRFWVDGTSSTSGFMHLRELKWLSGEALLPADALASSAGNDDVELLTTSGGTSLLYNAFDENQATHFYAGVGQELTVHFKNDPVYATGVRVTSPSWSRVSAFRCEGSVDGETWTLLYETSELTGSDFPNTADGNKYGDFDFGFSLPDNVDTAAPSVPANLVASDVSDTGAIITWDPSVDSGSGLSHYRVFVDGTFVAQATSEQYELSGLIPETEYEVTVAAVDADGNESAPSAGLLVMTTEAVSGEGVAKAYNYLRFWVDGATSSDGAMHLKELKWLSGDNLLPANALSSSAVEDVEVLSTTGGGSLLYNAFDEDTSTHYYASVNKELTLHFKNAPVYATGIRFGTFSYSRITAFHCEGSVDGETWSLIYETSGLTGTDFPGRDGNMAYGDFDFGLTLPEETDTVAPSVPAGLSASGISEDEATIAWDASTDADSGVAYYRVFVDGLFKMNASGLEAQLVDLSADTEYSVTVSAVDVKGNESEQSTPLLVTTAVGSGGIAQSYRYLRFWVDASSSDPSPMQLRELRWLFGDKEMPFALITNSTGDDSVEITTSTGNLYAFDGPWKLFDGDTNSHWYVASGNEVTLDFKDTAVIPTGVRVASPSWSRVAAFRCEASNDGETWTELYEATGLTGSDYPDTWGSVKSGDFDFGLTIPDTVDQSPPSVPDTLAAPEVSDVEANITWAASVDAGIGVSSYRIFVEGEFWNATADPELHLLGLSPNTSYDVTITAVDLYGNESAPSAILTVTTGDRDQALDPMVLGVGLGSGTSGIWKSGVNYANEWANYETSNPFNPVFLEELAHYKVIRFMDMIPTNNNWIANWEDRRQPDDLDQSANQNYTKETIKILKGVAVEWMIKLCNLLEADMWINIPHAATDDYVAQLANLIRHNLDPDLKIMVEYSNEAWAGFAAEAYTQEQGYALGLEQGDFPRYGWFGDDAYARFRFYVMRSLELHEIFDASFGEESHRVYKVLSGWSNFPDLSKVHRDALSDPLINPNGREIDGYALAPYFAFTVSGSDEAMLADFYTKLEALKKTARDHYEVWSAEGIPMITYEGGQHITSAGEAASRNPLMHKAYMDYLDALAPFYQEFTHFVHHGGYGRGSAWGSKEYVGQPDLLAYKYRAMKDWWQVNKDLPEASSPIIVSQPSDAVVGEGSGATFEVVAIGKAPFIYTWYRNGEIVANEDSAKLQLSNLAVENDGDEYYVVVTNSLGPVISETAHLTVSALPGKAEIKFTSASIVVDGVMDAAWADANVYPIARVNRGVVDDTADLDGSYRVLWNAAGLFFYVEVQDDVLVYNKVGSSESAHSFDSVEFYLDADNAKSSSYQNDGQYVYNIVTGLGASAGNPDLTGVLADGVEVTGGYTAEFFVPWSNYGESPSGGDYIGFDLMIADTDIPDTDVSEGKKAWWTDVNQSWTNPSYFGTGILLAEEVVAVPGDVTGDGVVDATDLNLVRSAIGSRVGSANYIEALDYDHDGVISRSDYSVWYGIARRNM